MNYTQINDFFLIFDVNFRKTKCECGSRIFVFINRKTDTNKNTIQFVGKLQNPI